MIGASFFGRLVWVAAAVGLAGGLAACERCERTACQAIRHPYRGEALAQGMAGVVAYESDLSINGCITCGWQDARIDLWETGMLVASAAEADRVVTGGPPRTTILAHHRYEKSLNPGNYLACVLPGSCAVFSLAVGEVASVNVRRIYGPAGLVLFPPGSDSRPERVFPQTREPPVVAVQLDGSGYFAGGSAARIEVLEPDGRGGGGLRFVMVASQDSRQLSFSVTQPQPWPPSRSFDVGFSRENQNQVSQNDGSAHAVSRSGSLELSFAPEGRFTGSFEVMMEDLAFGQSLGQGAMRPARGTVSGSWMLGCSTGSGGGVWISDVGLSSDFCADVAHRAGIGVP